MGNRRGSARVGRGPIEKVSEPIKRDIIRFYQTGLPLKQIADKFGVSESYPSQLAARQGVKRGLLPTSSEDVAEIVKALAETVVENRQTSFPVPDRPAAMPAPRRPASYDDEEPPTKGNPGRPRMVERAKPVIHHPIASPDEIKRLFMRGVGRTGIAAMLRCSYREIDAALAKR